MKKNEQPNKARVGLYNIALRRVEECEKVKGQIIAFPVIFEKMCRGFSIKKREAFEILFILRDFGFIRIVPCRGVVIE